MKHFLVFLFLLFIPSTLSAAVYNGIATSTSGQPIAAATVTVCSGWSDSLIQNPKQVCTNYLPEATLYSNSELTTSLTNPFTADNSGRYSFFVATGQYTVSVESSGYTTFSTPESIGTGMPTPVVDEGGQVYNVKAYGAAGDGTTNDSPAFQTAYNNAVTAGGGVVYIPPSSGCYLLNSPINMANGVGVRVIVQGSWSPNSGFSGSSPGQICGNTGNVVFDVLGTGQVTFRDLDVTAQSGVTTPSLIGILLARNSSNVGPQQVHVYNCSFKMPLHTSGTTYSFGAYLYGAEEEVFVGDMFEADYPLVVSSTNAFSVTSPDGTIATGTQSETDNQFYGMELDTSGLGPAIYLSGASDLSISGHSWNFNTTLPYPAALYPYAFNFAGTVSNAFIQWRQEGFPGFLNVGLSLLYTSIFGTDAVGSTTPLHGVEFDDASGIIAHDNFNIRDDYSSPSTNYFYDSSTGSPTGVAILDDVNFACGAESNCVNIPIGNYNPGFPAYWRNVTWSGGSNNESPTISIKSPIQGSFTVPATAVAATSCTTLTTISASALGASAAPVNVQFGPKTYGSLFFLIGNDGGTLYPEVCNPTSGSITPVATTVYWKIAQ